MKFAQEIRVAVTCQQSMHELIEFGPLVTAGMSSWAFVGGLFLFRESLTKDSINVVVDNVWRI